MLCYAAAPADAPPEGDCAGCSAGLTGGAACGLDDRVAGQRAGRGLCMKAGREAIRTTGRLSGLTAATTGFSGRLQDGARMEKSPAVF